METATFFLKSKCIFNYEGTFEMLLSHLGVVIKDHSQQTEAETPDHRLTEGRGWETEWKGLRLLNMHL